MRWMPGGLGTSPSGFARIASAESERSIPGLPLTDADPRLINPGDLLHMRKGDVPSVRIHNALQYVGHLKSAPDIVAGDQSQR